MIYYCKCGCGEKLRKDKEELDRKGQGTRGQNYKEGKKDRKKQGGRSKPPLENGWKSARGKRHGERERYGSCFPLRFFIDISPFSDRFSLKHD